MARIALVLGLLHGCTNPATQVLVWADLEGPTTEATAVSAQIRVSDHEGIVRFDETRALAELSRPFSVSIQPLGGDASRRFRVEIVLLDRDGRAFARQAADGSFIEDELREIRLRFADDCHANLCGVGRTCVGGTCVRACFALSSQGEGPSVPATCGCECDCEGDDCDDGLCRPSDPVDEVDAGFEHACLIRAGRLWCWGQNASGQLGLGDRRTRDRPTEVGPFDGAVASVSGSEKHTCAIVEGGALFCWGDNADGQLGVSEPMAPTPQRVAESVGEFVHVDTGPTHSCAVRSDGELFCWGSNSGGMIAVAGTAGPLPPTMVDAGGASLGGFDRALVGAFHSCSFQRTASRLWCWGVNSNGVLGRNAPHDSVTPLPTPERVLLDEVTDAASGGWHAAAVSGNQVFTWGDEADGRLGFDIDDGEGVLEPRLLMDGVGVEAGLRRTCVFGEDESLHCFGTNESGELGIGAVAFGSDSEPPNLRTPQLLREERWTDIAMGVAFTCGIREGGALYCWGENRSGQLGIGLERGEQRTVPVRLCLP